MWAAALLAVSVMAARVVVTSSWARERLTLALEEIAGEYLDRSLEIESLSFELLPPSLDVRGLTIAGPQPDDPPFARIGRLLIDVDPWSLAGRRVVLEQVRLEEPRVYLEFEGEGRNNLPRPRKRRERAAPPTPKLRFGLRYLAVEDGTVEVDQRRLPLDLEARALEIRLSGGGELELEGTLAAQEVTVELPRARPYLGAVGLRIGVDRQGVAIRQARVSGPELAATVSGAVRWLDPREVVLEVRGQGTASLFEQLGYLRDEVRGPFRFEGGFAWRKEAWGFRGDVASPRMEVFGRQIRDVAGVVSGDRNGVRMDLERSRYGEGAMTGALAFTREGDRSSFEVDLGLDRIDLQRLLDDQDIPLQGLAGRVSGVFDYRFPLGEARRGSGWANLRVTPSPPGSAAGLRVSGSVPLVIDDGRIATGAARFTGSSERIDLQGFYDLRQRAGRFDYQIATERVERLIALLPLLADQEDEIPLWYPLGGEGEVEGTLTLESQRVRTALSLDLQGVEARGVSAERLSGRLAVDRTGVHEMRFELLRPAGGLIVTGSLPFQQLEEEEEEEDESAPPFRLTLDAAGWPVSEARPWLPFGLPVEGRVSGSLTLSGDLGAPVGELRGEIAPAVVAGAAGDALSLDLEFDSDEIRFRRLALLAPAGEVSLVGSLARADQSLELFLESDALRLDREPFASLLPGPVGGGVGLRGEIAGTLAQPRLKAEISWQEITLGGAAVGREDGAQGRISWAAGELELAGSFLGLVQISGGGHLDRDGTDLEISLSCEDLGALAGLAGREVPDLRGRVSGALSLRGAGADPADWTNLLSLEILETEYAGRRLHNLEPVEIELAPGSVEILSLFVGDAESDSELFLAGVVGLDETVTLDLRLQSSLEISWLDLLVPDTGLQRGRFDVLATVGGTLEAPQLNGQGQLRDARLVNPGLPHALDNLRGLLLFYPQQVVVDGLRAEAAGGELLASGTLLPFAADGQPSYRLQISASGLEVRYPEGWQTRGGGEILVASTPEGRQIRGTLNLSRALYLQDVKLGVAQLLSRLFARERLEIGPADELLATTQLSLSVRGQEALRVRNNLANLRGDIDLVIRGNLARPIVFGRVTLDPQGTLVYGGNEYTVDRGLLSFTNPYRVEPVVDLVASTRVREYDVTLNLSGTLERLNAGFFSDPPLADLEVLTLLTTGESSGELGGAFTGEGESSIRATGLLYGQAASAISRRANQLFGLDRFRIVPLTRTTGDLSAARVTIGKRLSRDLFATYSYDPSTTEQQILQLEWDISRTLTLVLTQNGDESYSVDARWQKSF